MDNAETVKHIAPFLNDPDHFWAYSPRKLKPKAPTNAKTWKQLKKNGWLYIGGMWRKLK